jgi:isopenicillin-N N-acyltransferase-like protein
MKHFHGSFFDIGNQKGEIYRQNGLDLASVHVDKETVSKQMKIYEKYYPSLLEEIDGIAKGGGFDKEKLLQIYLAAEILHCRHTDEASVSCSIFGITNSHGTFVGRNLDWLPVTEQVMEPYRQEATGFYSLIAISDMFIGSPSHVQDHFMFYDAIDVINEKGLFIGITSASGDAWVYGLSWKELTRMIGERCSTVDEALEIFANTPISIPKNYFIADKTGKMVVVEHNSSTYKIIYPKDNILIHTNHYLDPELQKIDRVLIEIPEHNTYIRYYEILQKLNGKKDTFEQSDVIQILGNPKSYICQNHDIRTIWTLALDMGRQKYSLYTDVIGKQNKQDLVI